MMAELKDSRNQPMNYHFQPEKREEQNGGGEEAAEPHYDPAQQVRPSNYQNLKSLAEAQRVEDLPIGPEDQLKDSFLEKAPGEQLSAQQFLHQQHRKGNPIDYAQLKDFDPQAAQSLSKSRNRNYIEQLEARRPNNSKFAKPSLLNTHDSRTGGHLSPKKGQNSP